MSTITDTQQAIAHAVERVGPAVVGFGRGWGRGSGVVVAPAGSSPRPTTCVERTSP